jgi:phosphoribosylaminoimidazole-succinocarboxamide synthase
MGQNLFYKFASPQLKKLHSGKVRESYRVDNEHRMLIASDRLSCFDLILPRSFEGKGAILTQIAAEWFDLTRSLIPNHFVKTLAPNISLVREAKPIPVEMIARQYLTGSLWRAYEKGAREISGVRLPDGLEKNQAFETPILTPTTKEKIDRPITPEGIVKEGWASQSVYDEMASITLKLFAYGQEYCRKHGLVMVDAKYEFGIIDGKLALIDEIHTPDCARFCLLGKQYPLDEESPWFDKEYIRQWLLVNKSQDLILPDSVLEEAKRRYEHVYMQLFDKNMLSQSPVPLSVQAYYSLVQEQLIKPAYVAIVMGSKEDLEFAKKIKDLLSPYDLMVDMHIVSAHKNGERIAEIAETYNHSIEPGCVIAIAGRSNGLGGALSANLNIPVINCPPFKDRSDIQININSSLFMPSQAPAVTVVYPEQAVGAAIRMLNIPIMKVRIREGISKMKEDLSQDDKNLRKELGLCE